MLEYEKKVLLTPKEYEFLLNHIYTEGVRTIQTNYYYDTPELSMNELGITCRIRKKGDSFIATIKSHQSNEPECSWEQSFPVDTVSDSFPLENMQLILLGSLTTDRTVVHHPDEPIITIDKNTYLDMTDFELEIEYPKEKELAAIWQVNEIAHILAQHELISTPKEFIKRIGAGENKSQRFFKKKFSKGTV